MHEKKENLFVQKSQRQNKLPLSLFRFLLQILFDTNLSIWMFTITLVFTLNFLFILFDRNFYYFL